MVLPVFRYIFDLLTYLPQNKTDGIGPLVAFYSGLKGTILFGHLLRCNLGG